MFTLDYLKIWHRTFALHLELAIEGFEDLSLNPESVGNDAICELGKWIVSEQSQLANIPSFAKLITAHKEFHIAAKNVVASHLLGNMDAARGADIERLRVASSSVQSAIELLERELQGTKTFPCANPYLPASGTSSSLWDDSLIIGVPVIDEQHRAMAFLADKALRQSSASLSSEAGVDFLTKMTRLLTLHFDTEEWLMNRIPLPESDREAHFAMHTSILEQVTSLSYDLSQGIKIATIFDVAPLFRSILIDHVVGFDHGLIPYLNRSGA